MNIEDFRTQCLLLKGSEETFPFDEDTLVFKVGGKMFALISLSSPYSCNLKCDPDYARELRETYQAVTPGFHMNKSHWNTVAFNQDVDDQLLIDLLKHSYQAVLKSLPKKTQLLVQES